MNCGYLCLIHDCAGFAWNKTECKLYSEIELIENSEASDQSCFKQGKYYFHN